MIEALKRKILLWYYNTYKGIKGKKYNVGLLGLLTANVMSVKTNKEQTKAYHFMLKELVRANKEKEEKEKIKPTNYTSFRYVGC